MATAMLNVRLDKALKTDGERVLAKQGVSATEAIRGLYRFLQQNQEVPGFCRDEDHVPTPEERRERMRQLVGIAKMDSGEDAATLKAQRLSRWEL